MSELSFINVRDFDSGDGKNVRATKSNPTSPDVDIYTPHHVHEVAPVEDRVSGTGHATNGTTTPVTGMGVVTDKRNYVNAVQVANAGTSAVLVLLQDGSGGSTLAYIYCPAGQTVPVQYPSPLRTTATTGLYFQVVDSVPSPATTSVYVSAQGYTE